MTLKTTGPYPSLTTFGLLIPKKYPILKISAWRIDDFLSKTRTFCGFSRGKQGKKMRIRVGIIFPSLALGALRAVNFPAKMKGHTSVIGIQALKLCALLQILLVKIGRKILDILLV